MRIVNSVRWNGHCQLAISAHKITRIKLVILRGRSICECIIVGSDFSNNELASLPHGVFAGLVGLEELFVSSFEDSHEFCLFDIRMFGGLFHGGSTRYCVH